MPCNLQYVPEHLPNCNFFFFFFANLVLFTLYISDGDLGFYVRIFFSSSLTANSNFFQVAIYILLLQKKALQFEVESDADYFKSYFIIDNLTVQLWLS